MQRTQQSGFDSALIREQMMAGGAPLSPKNLDEIMLQLWLPGFRVSPYPDLTIRLSRAEDAAERL